MPLSIQSKKQVRNLNSFCTRLETLMQTWQHFSGFQPFTRIAVLLPLCPMFCHSALTTGFLHCLCSGLPSSRLCAVCSFWSTTILGTHQISLHLREGFLNHSWQKGGLSSFHPSWVTLAKVYLAFPSN